MAALILASAVVAPTAASAAPGVVSGLTATVLEDGTAPFTEAGGLDDGPNNGQVRTNDIVTYKVTANFSTLGDATFQATLPQGARWHDSAKAVSVWNGPGGASISSDGRTLTGSRSALTAVEQYDLKVWVHGFGNGTSFAPTFIFGGVNATAPGVTVTAEPETETTIQVQRQNGTVVQDGVPGVGLKLSVRFGTTKNDVRGLEALSPDFSFTLDVPAGVIATSAAPYRIGGSATVQQDLGPGTPIVVNVAGTDTSFVAATHVPASEPWKFAGPLNGGAVEVMLFVPYDPYLPLGEITDLQTFQLRDFDPDGKGGSSNFGAGFAPGQAPDDACPSPLNGNSGLACAMLRIDRTNDFIIQVSPTVTVSAPDRRLLTGDVQTYDATDEFLLPGQQFITYSRFGNHSSASSAATEPYACTTFNNDAVALMDAATLASGVHSASVVHSPLPESDRIIEYSAAVHADDVARASFDCGRAGDGAGGWFSNLSDVPGGITAVTAVRAKALTNLEPGTGISLELPLQRQVSMTAGETTRWFFSYGTNETPHMQSPVTGNLFRGGDIEATDVLVRHRTSVAASAVAGGQNNTVTIKPIMTGAPITGHDATAEQVKVRVDFSHTTVNPDEESLDALGIDYDLTPADAGPDGILGTSDDGASASVIFNLGDVHVPGGAVTNIFRPTGNGGHETLLPELRFDVVSSILTPNARNHVLTSVISANNDATVERHPGANDNTNFDRTEFASFLVNGVSGFQTVKTATTTDAGTVAPGEKFEYNISWANTALNTYGATTFVDLLPFNGDGRGTTGLDAAGFEVLEVTAEMDNPSVMGDVTIEYTTDAAADVRAALTDGNENGDTGITWQQGAVPANATAIRFITEENLAQGFTGHATITLRAPEIAVGGKVVNDIWGRTAPINNDPDTVMTMAGVAENTLTSSAAQVSGTVWRDLNFNGVINEGGPDETWESGFNVELVPMNGDPAVLAEIQADGSYHVSVAPGEYDVRLPATIALKWNRVMPTTTITVATGEVLTDVNLLYHEIVQAAQLVDDTAKALVGTSVTIDVTANDTLYFPETTGSVYTADGVGLGATTPTYGSVTLDPPAAPSNQSHFTYITWDTWPPEFDGEASYTDTFDYTWTNATGDVQTATVTVTVIHPVYGTNASATIPVGGTTSLNAAIVGDGVTAGAITGIPAGATANVNAVGVMQFNGGTAQPGTYPMTVTFTDSMAQTVTITYTVTIQAPPAATDQSAIIPMGGTTTLNAGVTGTNTTAGTPSGVPAGATATVSNEGVLQFNAGDIDAGTYPISVTFTDDLGQAESVVYTITVQAIPTATGGTAFIGGDAIHTFDAEPTADPAVPSASITDAAVTTQPAAGTVTLNDGSVSFDSTGAWNDTFTFEVTYTDNLGQKVTVPFSVTVQLAPVATGQTSTTIGEGQTAIFDLDIATSGTITDATVTTAPSAGTVNAETNGTVTFASGDAEPGVYVFEVTFTDDIGQRTIITFTVTVQEMITVADQSATIGEGGSHTFTEMVTTTGTYTRTVTTQPAAGSVSDGSVVYHAGDAAPGTYEIGVTYVDNVGQSTVATYTVTVQAMPKGMGKTVQTDSDTETIGFDPIADTVGTNLQPIAETDVTQPGHGSVAIVDGRIVYTPERGYNGDTSFTVAVRDDLGQRTVLTYTVQVTLPQQSAPAAPAPKIEGRLVVTGGDGQAMNWILTASILFIALGLSVVATDSHLRRKRRRH